MIHSNGARSFLSSSRNGIRPMTRPRFCSPTFSPPTQQLRLHPHGQDIQHVLDTSLFNLQTVRTKKTKTTIELKDLPQGALPRDPLPSKDSQDEPSYPTVVLQARRNMQKFDNCVLLTRVGGFYELYFEHAEDYGPLLNLKVASKKTSAGPVPMVRPDSCHCVVPIVGTRKYKNFKMLTPSLVWLPLLPIRSLPQDTGARPQSLCCHCRGISQRGCRKGQVRRSNA